MRKLENKLVLITGGASGVGLECAKHFARLGAHLLLIGRDKKKLGRTCRLLSNQFKVNVLQLAGDVKDSKFAFAALISVPSPETSRERPETPPEALEQCSGPSKHLGSCSESIPGPFLV